MIFKPPNVEPGVKYPTVLFLYGGPHVQVTKLLGALSICQNWPARPVSSYMGCTNLKDKFYPSPLNFFKIARASFVVINIDFAAPSLQNDAFDLQTG